MVIYFMLDSTERKVPNGVIELVKTSVVLGLRELHLPRNVIQKSHRKSIAVQIFRFTEQLQLFLIKGTWQYGTSRILNPYYLRVRLDSHQLVFANIPVSFAANSVHFVQPCRPHPRKSLEPVQFCQRIADNGRKLRETHAFDSRDD